MIAEIGETQGMRVAGRRVGWVCGCAGVGVRVRGRAGAGRECAAAQPGIPQLAISNSRFAISNYAISTTIRN